MFKSIQDKIIFSNPLLWNIKLIPMLIVLAIFHTIVFFIGYFHGTIDLEYSLLPHRDKEGTFIIIMSLIMFLIFILWIYFYMRNNAFEHFYPKKALDIYKEWLLILLITFLIVGFPITYFFGKETKIRSYISYENLEKEKDVIKMSSVFLIGDYNISKFKYVNDYNSKIEIPDSLITQNSIQVLRDTIIFNKKAYPFYSYLNKSIDKISGYYTTDDRDSILERKVKLFLQNDDKKAVTSLFEEFIAIQKKYKHKQNIDANKWIELCYNYPNFEEKILIAKITESQYSYKNDSSNTEENLPINSENIDKEIYKNSIRYYTKNNTLYFTYKYYVDYDKTARLLGIFESAYKYEECNFMLFFGLFYFAGFLSLILFLYKMTQWKNWLISIISGVIIAIVIGILAAIIDRYFMNRYEGILIGTIIILLFLVVFGFFLFTIYKSKSKKFSGVLLGLSLPVIVSIFPLIVFFVFDTIKEFSGYNDDVSIDRDKFYPWVSFFDDLLGLVPFLNVIFVIIMMYFMSFWIKKWKSLPEA